MAKTKSNELPKTNVVFVCSGNTCRSPMAEYIFKSHLRSKKVLSKYAVSSAGVFAASGDGMNPLAIETLTCLKIAPKKPHKARLTTVDVIQNADIIVCMTAAHRSELTAGDACAYALGDGKERIIGTVAELIGIDIADPYGGTAADYAHVAGQLETLCEPLLAGAEKFRNRSKT